ncbi:MAG: SPOR domain-containing protein, partial [Pseudomonadota bacterium]
QGFVETATTWIGALLAMLLIAAIGLWLYQLGLRDVRDVPVFRASAEPVKERPVDAGGEVTPHQNIASYDAGEAPVARPAPRLAPPPPEPAPEDVAMAELEAATLAAIQTAPADEPEVEPVVETPAPAPEVTREEPPAEDGETLALADQPVPTPAARPASLPVAAPAEPEPEPTPEPVLEAPVPALGVGSPHAPAFAPAAPPSRPSDLRARMASAQRALETDADDLARRAGDSRIKIQLRASPYREEVTASWAAIQAANRDLLGGKALVTQTTLSGGITYYRLRVGPFRDRAEANAVCEALRARGQDCIVTIDG